MREHVVIASTAQSSTVDWLNVPLPLKFKDSSNNSIKYDLLKYTTIDPSENIMLIKSQNAVRNAFEQYVLKSKTSK